MAQSKACGWSKKRAAEAVFSWPITNYKECCNLRKYCPYDTI